MHQINPLAVPTNDFLLWIQFFSFFEGCIILIGYTLFQKRKKVSTEKSTSVVAQKRIKERAIQVLLISTIGIMMGISMIFNLKGAKLVDAVILYPIVSGGVIILNSLFGWIFYKEKANFYSVAGVIIAFLGTILFAV